MTRREIIVTSLLGIVAIGAAPLTAIGLELYPEYKPQIFAGSATIILLALGTVAGIAFWPKKRPPKPMNKAAVAASWITLSVDVKNAMSAVGSTGSLEEYDAAVARLTKQFEKRLKKAYLQMLDVRVDPPPYPFEFTTMAKFLEWWTTLREEGHKLLDDARGQSRKSTKSIP